MRRVGALRLPSREVHTLPTAPTRTTQLTTLAAGLGMAAGVAWGGVQQGTVTSVDPAQKTVRLHGGAEFWLVPGLSLAPLTRGRRVTIVYDERAGKKWARTVEGVT